MHKHSAIEVSSHNYEKDVERNEGRRARVAAREKLIDCYGSFIERGKGKAERLARISLLEDQIRDTVSHVCSEYNYDHPGRLADELLAQWRKQAETSYQHATVDPDTPLDTEPSVGVGGNHSYHEDEIDVRSEHNRAEKMDPEQEEPDFTKQVEDTDVANPKLVKTIDADQGIGSEETGDGASFPAGGPNSAVTSNWTIL